MRDDDLVGLLAYSMYKQRKRDWIIEFGKQQGRDPTADEARSFLIGETTSSRLNDYRQQSELILASYGDEIIKGARPSIEREAVAGRIEASLAWHKQVPGGIVAALSYTLILIALAIILRLAGVDLLGVLNAVRL